MELPNKKPKADSGGHYPPPSYGPGYGYGTSGGGYGYGGYPGYGVAGTTMQRSLQDYLLILRERIWYIIIVFLAVLSATLIFTFTRTKLYQSTATLQIFRRSPTVLEVQQVVDNGVNSAEDMNTQIGILNSSAIIDRVAARLTPGESQQLVAPYEKPGQPSPSVKGILGRNRSITPQKSSRIIAIQFRHPNPELAGKAANLLADECVSYNAHVTVDESMKAAEELELRANEQRKTVDNIARALQAYREKNHMISLDQRKDIVNEKLRVLNTNVTQDSVTLQEAQTRWEQVLACQQQTDKLLNLPFITNKGPVGGLQQQLASGRITIAQLSNRYRAKHPAMIAAVNAVGETQRLLDKAVADASAQVQNDYQTGLQNYTHARAALAAQEADSLTVDRFALEYTNMQRDLEINEKLLEQILARMQETSISSSLENQTAQIIDHAGWGGLIFPNYTLFIAVGAVGGLGLGLAVAFLVAFIDDRIKSTYDIEAIVGLPLLAIIPEFKEMAKSDAKRESAGSGDLSRDVSEAFATLHSHLRLKDESKKAQCILVTSTVAGEGKSFISRNLATTFADHGERVLLMDCDLRRPVVHQGFQVENLKGLIDVCTTGAKPEDVIIKNAYPNLDIMTTGGRSKNPSQTLNSKAFEVMLSELRKKYDRIVVDTPPIAIVSDALVVLPLMDGSVYSIYFNRVRRKAAQVCVQRMLDVNVPHFGAVLNGLNKNLGGYYYSHYYGGAYKNYYTSHEKDINGVEIKEPRNHQMKSLRD